MYNNILLYDEKKKFNMYIDIKEFKIMLFM